MMQLREYKKASYEVDNEFALARLAAMKALVDGWAEMKQPLRAEKWLQILEKVKFLIRDFFGILALERRTLAQFQATPPS